MMQSLIKQNTHFCSKIRRRRLLWMCRLACVRPRPPGLFSPRFEHFTTTTVHAPKDQQMPRSVQTLDKRSHVVEGFIRDAISQILLLAAGRTAGTVRLNWRTLHRSVRAEHATVTGFRAQQRLATRTFIEELASIYRHGFLIGKATAGAGQDRLQHNSGRGHGFELCGVAGKPASVVALTNTARLAFSGSNFTVAVLWL